jgi:hypothetical protein
MEPGRPVGACPHRRCGEVVIFKTVEGRFVVEQRHRRAG